MVTPAVDGIDLFKIAGRSISGWIPSFKMGAVSPIRQPFCSQLEERLLMWLEYHPQVVSYARGDIGPAFASAYRLPLPKDAPFAIGYTFEAAFPARRRNQATMSLSRTPSTKTSRSWGSR